MGYAREYGQPFTTNDLQGDLAKAVDRCGGTGHQSTRAPMPINNNLPWLHKTLLSWGLSFGLKIIEQLPGAPICIASYADNWIGDPRGDNDIDDDMLIFLRDATGKKFAGRRCERFESWQVNGYSDNEREARALAAIAIVNIMVRDSVVE